MWELIKGRPLNISVSGASQIEDIALKSDGTKLLVVDRAQDKIHEYTVDPAYDISEASIVSGGDLDMTSDNKSKAAYSGFLCAGGVGKEESCYVRESIKIDLVLFFR